MIWLIQSAEGDPIPTYYSAKVGRDIGATYGWTSREHEATPFDSQEAAVIFADKRMGHVRVNIVEKKL